MIIGCAETKTADVLSDTLPAAGFFYELTTSRQVKVIGFYFDCVSRTEGKAAEAFFAIERNRFVGIKKSVG